MYPAKRAIAGAPKNIQPTVGWSQGIEEQLLVTKTPQIAFAYFLLLYKILPPVKIGSPYR